VAGLSWKGGPHDYHFSSFHAATLWIGGVATEIPLIRVTDMNNTGAIIGQHGADWVAWMA
jgi:hypothetical protein